MQDEWLSKKADEIQSYADLHGSKCFCKALKCFHSPQSSGSSPLLSADGTKLITDQNKILERWAKHFSTVLNHPTLINDEAIQCLPQVPDNHEFNAPPTLSETQKAIGQLSNGKAPRADAILAEDYKYGGPVLHQKLGDIFQSIWQQGTVLQDFKNALIIHLSKRKGNCQQCDNHHGISLLPITGKVLARVLLKCLTMHLEKGLLPESQCSFQAGQGTVDMISTARQLQEKCQEQRCDLYTTFVDLTKAFDTVSRDGWWKILAKYGCPEKFISIVQQFHDGMRAHVQDNGDISEAFAVTNGVKQGCVLAPVVFCLMFLVMLQDAFHHSEDGICITHRTDGKLHNQCHLKAVTMVKQTVIRDLSVGNFGLTISTQKLRLCSNQLLANPISSLA